MNKETFLQMLSEFAKTNLKLTFNSKTKIFKNIQGVNFCGYKINENRLKIRNQSKYRKVLIWVIKRKT